MWLTKKETAEKAESVKTGVVTTGGGEISVFSSVGGTIFVSSSIQQHSYTQTRLHGQPTSAGPPLTFIDILHKYAEKVK